MFDLAELAKILNAEIIGDGGKTLVRLGTLEKAGADEIACFFDARRLDDLKTTKAGAVLLAADFVRDCPTNALVVHNPRLAFAALARKFTPQKIKTGIHPSAVISKSAKIKNANIGAGAVIGENVEIGKNAFIGANCVIENGVRLGDFVVLGENVTICQKVEIGKHSVIHSGAVIGSAGFGNVRDNEKHWHFIEHFGGVIIGENVRIGANTTIDRGTIENTEIRDGVRIDNLVHIAHNVIIKEHTAIAACSGVAGSSVIGKRCMIGGMVGIIDHIHITDDVTIHAMSTVKKDISTPGIYTGSMPLLPHKRWKKVAVWLTKLDRMADFLKIRLSRLKEK